jgi:hypothetical protein
MSGASFLRESSVPAYFQNPLGIKESVKLHEFGNEPGPPCLVTSAQPGAIVA